MSPEIVPAHRQARTVHTLIMVGLSGLLGTLFGLPLGVFLATSRTGELFRPPWPTACSASSSMRRVRRLSSFWLSLSCLLTRLIVGTSIGTRAAVVPLTIAAIPFIGRVVEAAIREVDQGLVEAARAFGASPLQIVRQGVAAGGLAGPDAGTDIERWSACLAIRRWSARSAAAALAILAFVTDTSASCRR